jgi:molybdopterin/thiamine biosynthesis adenylyltransferase
MKKFLKRKLFVRQTPDCIMIGEGETILYKDHDKDTLDVIARLVGEGISPEEGENIPLFKELESYDWFCDEYPSVDRTGDFFEKIKVDFPASSKDKPILILGAGGAGGTLTYMLGQFGFTNLHIVDFDSVEPSDCRKSMAYRMSDVGELKTDAMQRILKENFSIDVSTYKVKINGISEINSLIEKTQPVLIINAIDPDPIHKLHLNEAAFKARIPYFVVAYSYEYLFIGPFVIPGTTSCFESVRKMQMDATEKKYDIRQIQDIHHDYFIHPAISFVTNSVASVAVKEIMFYLANRLDLLLTLDKILWFSMLDMSGTLIEIQCAPDCPICGADKVQAVPVLN